MAKRQNWHRTLRTGFKFPKINPRMSLSEAVTVATNAIAEHLLHSKDVHSYLRNISRGTSFCPKTPLETLVSYVAVQRGEIDKSDPVLNLGFHKRIIMPVFQFEREEVLRAVLLIDDTTKKETRIFDLCERLGTWHDRLWAQWFEKVVCPFQSLSDAGRQKYEKRAKEILAQYDYTVFDDGFKNRSSWKDAFPEEISAIVDILFALEKVSDSRLGNYFSALAKAYNCMDINLLEEMWANVDRAWVAIPPTSHIVPVHGMESGYEHPFCVSPEFRVEVRTADFAEIISRRRTSVLKHAETFSLQKQTLAAARKKLEHIDIAVFATAVRSGVDLNFRHAGQAVPNRQNILELGGKIFVAPSTSVHSAELYRKYLKENCTPKTYAVLKPYVVADSLTIHTIDHEYSHPVGCTQESNKALGNNVMKLLEEAKATMLGNLADEYEDTSEENRLRLVALTVSRLLRFMQKETLSNTTLAPYVRENFVAITTLVESGVMTLTTKGISVNIEKAKSALWFNELWKFCRGVVLAYEKHDSEGVKELTKKYCALEKDPIAGVISWVHRKH